MTYGVSRMKPQSFNEVCKSNLDWELKQYTQLKYRDKAVRKITLPKLKFLDK